MCALPLDLQCSLNTYSKDGVVLLLPKSPFTVAVWKGDVLGRCVNLEINCVGDLTTSLTGDQLYGNCK